MKPSPTTALSFLVLLLALAGCQDEPGYDHTYTTRGEVLSLPGDKATQEFIVHHETIPDYVSITGSIGMNEMAMPIPVPDRSALEGIAVGDKVELTFGERFEPNHTMGLISIRKLAPETELSIGKASENKRQITAQELLGRWESVSISSDREQQPQVEAIRLVIEKYELRDTDIGGNPYGDGKYRVSLFEKRAEEDDWYRAADSEPGGIDNSNPEDLVLRLGPIGSHLAFRVSPNGEGIKLIGSGISADLVRADPIPDAEGFTPIFDGKTLDGWEGDTRYWSVEAGSIVGQFTKENQPPDNTFLIWRGGGDGVVADFELKFQYRITEGGNSGVQYRSQQTEGFGMKGYQADIHHGPRWTGVCYDEHGRKVLADRGQSVVLEAGQKPKVVDQFADRDELMQAIDLEGWNEYHIMAKGNRLVHRINGVKMAEVVDNDEAQRELSGLLALQIHRSVPKKVEFKSIRLKTLD